ncbi:adenylate cyclase, terminal-differentiation specific-like [Trichechus manatus latirostris]|uniref:Adenylate cyclase, terminal-differentiation specific-like n=1 Tax=Trichechus manatus latirostris TaxID=127582 RepID=A0A2Y9QE43_TRIMA|nr:adenylate cyclase, terminal-differentiation specific-like [Trichechus manatus latirostris]
MRDRDDGGLDQSASLEAKRAKKTLCILKDELAEFAEILDNQSLTCKPSGTNTEAPKDIPEQSFSYAQETLLGRAGCSSLDTQGVPSQQLHLSNQPLSPTSSVEHFDRDRTERGQSQYASPCLQHHVYSVHGVRQQQEEQKNSPHSPLQGQQQNGWQCHLQQPQQPQHCQEKLQFQHPSHGDLGQQLPSLQSQEQSWYPQNNGGSLRSQLQQAPSQTVARSPPLPLGQDMQHGAAEQPWAQQQQLWDKWSARSHGWE